ncbi:LysR family transcriptional regulator [Actinobacillus pleuropneumoniae]|uniref:LysR family transcriptional regulator n=1 Tax=Actinobacillus pleuropneumoniae TaxID=715 RepID=A0A9Q4H5H0_ACTPL|nr:LysR family transcriptional regulator [Actinobacillus pleuropneumoniae]MCL7720540.1 LysR family transcriptional regulator [Actinobacillus pleuropneumoniae]MCL7727914.1 LysR family transcriptional regulator [Actinobacillus pleuropneumoniae]MCL7729735.1 LysR family transcriptional regulator [Actinobacillus pleuropneumoniae]MCY6367718.1 LysR family transcriptional regulator [Actinobacillus pleuropneumoniae]MCY6384586.1 LysR family transcriptional regulator [Actinobacillus pleuropneumoniae]
MDLNNLRLFVAVYQAESFSKAAEQLAMPGATVSRRIAEFEKSLSTQLFDRYKTGVKPTALGLQLYEKVYLILDNLTQATQDFIGEQQELSGYLRISTVSVCEPIWAAIAEFQAEYPQVKVHCQATDRVLDLVEDGIDIAFRMGDLHTENVIARKMMDLNAVLVAHPDFLARHGTPKTLQDLTALPFACWARVGQKSATLQLGEQAVKIEPIFTSNDVYAIAHQAKSAHAICQLPDYMAQELTEKFGLVELMSDYQTSTYPIHAIYPAHRHPSAIVKTFLGFCERFLAEREKCCKD